MESGETFTDDEIEPSEQDFDIKYLCSIFLSGFKP